MMRIVLVGNVSACAAAVMPATVSKAISQCAMALIVSSPSLVAKSMRLLNFDIAILHDLLPAWNFLPEKNRELVRRAAKRIDTEDRDLVGEVRVLQGAADFAIEFLHDVLGRALGGDDADPCGDAKTRQSRLVQSRDVGRDPGPAQAGLAERRQAVVADLR